MKDLDFSNPLVEQLWCSERRSEVVAYMETTGVQHGEIGEWPAWHIPPYVSVFAVESGVNPGAVGWWVICGDLPTDYQSGSYAANPREAVRSIASRWQRMVQAWEIGQSLPGFEIGDVESRKELMPLLKSRAAILLEWCEDDSIWD